MTHNNPKLKECKNNIQSRKDKDIVIEDLCFIKFTKKEKLIYILNMISIYMKEII